LKPLLSAIVLTIALSAPATAETVQPTPGIVAGRVLDTSGRPLAGAVLYLERLAIPGRPLHGKTDDTGAYTVKTLKLPLIYRAHAWMPLTYRGKNYCVRIAPETESDKADIAGPDGAIRNFRWQLQGPVDPSVQKPDDNADFYGSTLRLMLDFADGGYDSTIDLELTPDGPLIDGSAGKVLRYHVDLTKTVFVNDIPVGAYTVRATRITRDGQRAPVRIGPSAGEAKETATLEFNPHETTLSCGSATTDNGIDRAFLTVVAP